MLNFIGIGSAFNTSLGNNSAYIKDKDSLLLIDCGGTVFHKLQEINLLQGVQNFYIIITHTHPDHIGSLGDTIFYSYYILNKIPIIIYPNKEVMENYLRIIGVTPEMYKLISQDKVTLRDKSLGNFNIEFINSSHVDTMAAYSFLLTISENTIYYSGDSNNIEKDIITRFINKEIDYIYQDTCGLDYKGNGHLYIKKLSSLIPLECRDRVYCMHLDGHISEEEILEEGFKIAGKGE